MPDIMYPVSPESKSENDSAVVCKSFYNGTGLKSNLKGKTYLTPLERKEIRNLKNITLENRIVTNTAISANGSHKSSKARAATKKPTAIKPLAKGAKKKPLQDKYQFDPYGEPSVPRMSTPKKNFMKQTPKARTYSWAPNSLKSQYLKAKWKFQLKDVTIPRHQSLLNRSLPTKTSSTMPEDGPCEEEDTKSLSFSVPGMDVAVEDVVPPEKKRKLDTSTDSSPPSTLSNSIDSSPDGADKVLSLEEDSAKTLASKFYPIFTKAAPKTHTLAKKKAISTLENGSPVTPENLAVAAPGGPVTRGRKTHEECDEKQLIIDAGQKRFGATHCSTCGMVFSANHPGDEQDHVIYHKRFLNFIRFSGWKNERLVTSFMDGRIIKVLPGDPKYATRKATDILTIVDTDLGFKTLQAGLSSTKVAYLFISDAEKVVGCLIAEKISSAFRLLPYDESKKSGEPSDNFICFSASTPTSAVCGVSRIWTYSPMRRKGIATRLLDTVRSTFILGIKLDINQVAFSDPTPDGRAFATDYFKRPDILVYSNVR